MTSRVGRSFVLAMLTILGTLVALAVYQVPQPWRGVLVAWLFVCLTLGTLVLHLVKHHYEFKAMQGKKGPPPRRRAAPSMPDVPRFEGLKVVVSTDGSKRYTLR